MSEFAVKIKNYYELGLWNLKRLKNAVQKGAISEQEYKAITGKEYIA